MNILHHKSWHVRTKKNIAKVRKDEAKAAAEEKEVQRRVSLASQEARTKFLREKASLKLAEVGTEAGITLSKVTDFDSGGHINFFQDIEEGIKQDYEVNKEHEEEKKKEQEDYEKKIGYLVYLGQDTKEKSWYEKIGQRDESKSSDINSTSEDTSDKSSVSQLKVEKIKDFYDPIKDIRKYLSTPGIKSKMEKLNKPSTSTSTTNKLKADENSYSNRKRKNESELESSSKKQKKHKKKEKKHKNKKSKKKKNSKKSESEVELSYSSEDEVDSEEEKEKKKRLEKLRVERLEREREEHRRAEKIMKKLRGEPDPDVEKEKAESSSTKSLFPSHKQRYNSQFNPHLAKQNFDR